MNPLFKKLHTAAEGIALRETERDSMRAALDRHVREHPIEQLTLPVRSPYHFFTLQRTVALVMAPVVLLLGAGGTAYAAAGSLPGDMLYPVKISVNERVESALALSPLAKAQVHVSLAQRRLEEAQALAQAGRLDASTTQELQSNLDAHAQEAQTITQTLVRADPADAAEISAQLTSSLAVNSAVLEDLGNKSKDENTRKDIRALAAEARIHIQSAMLAMNADFPQEAPAAQGNGSTSRSYAKDAPPPPLAASSTIAGSSTASSSAVSAASTSPSGTAQAALRLGQRATERLAHAANLLSSIKLSASAEARIQTQLDRAHARLLSGNAKLRAGDAAGAFADFAHAYAAAVHLEASLIAGDKWGNTLLEQLLQSASDTQGAAVIDNVSTTTNTADGGAASTSVKSVNDQGVQKGAADVQIDISR